MVREPVAPHIVPAVAGWVAGLAGAVLIVVATAGAVISAAATRPAAIFVPRFHVCGCESTTGAYSMAASGTERTVIAARWRSP